MKLFESFAKDFEEPNFRHHVKSWVNLQAANSPIYATTFLFVLIES